MLDYSPLWDTMEKRKISQYRLLKAGIDNKTLDTLKKGGNITLLTLEKLCDKIMWMHEGEIVKIGDTQTILPEYIKFMEEN